MVSTPNPTDIHAVTNSKLSPRRLVPDTAPSGSIGLIKNSAANVSHIGKQNPHESGLPTTGKLFINAPNLG